MISDEQWKENMYFDSLTKQTQQLHCDDVHYLCLETAVNFQDAVVWDCRKFLFPLPTSSNCYRVKVMKLLTTSSSTEKPEINLEIMNRWKWTIWQQMFNNPNYKKSNNLTRLIYKPCLLIVPDIQVASYFTYIIHQHAQ